MGDLRVKTVYLSWDGNQITALIGPNLQYGVGGFGSTVQDALRDLAANIERRAHPITLRVPRAGKAYQEDGITKVACPECEYVEYFPEPEVIAYICPQCGMDIDVQWLPDQQKPAESTQTGQVSQM
jgi:hypothetical protein